MNELAVIENEGKQAINARDLHAELGVKRDFSTWIRDRIEKYDFVEGVDYQLTKSGEVVERAQGGGTARDVYFLTLATAKEIAVVENNEAGKEIRRYLIKVEEAWNTPETIMARALQMSQRQLEGYKQQVALMKPKADFYDAVADSKESIPMREVAALLNIKGLGRNKLFALLRDKGVFDEHNIPYRKYQERGYFRVVESYWEDSFGSRHLVLTTFVYQRGLDWIRKIAEGGHDGV
jgi:anti-repressor protein